MLAINDKERFSDILRDALEFIYAVFGTEDLVLTHEMELLHPPREPTRPRKFSRCSATVPVTTRRLLPVAFARVLGCGRAMARETPRGAVAKGRVDARGMSRARAARRGSTSRRRSNRCARPCGAGSPPMSRLGG